MSKTRNILIFVAIGIAFVLIYIFFIKPAMSSQPDLVPSSGSTSLPITASDSGINVSSDGTTVAQDFLSLLLSVKTIKLNVDIFSDPTFTGLHDSSVTLVPDATIGRPNPFAQFGVGNVVTPASNITTPTLTPSPPTPPTSH